MAMLVANVAARAACDGVHSVVDAAGQGATLVVFAGPRPNDLSTFPDEGQNPALVTFSLPNPAFMPAEDALDGTARASANPVPSASADTAGTATFYRILDAAGQSLMEGSVSEPGGGGDLEVSDAEITAGLQIQVFALNAVVPES